MKLQERVLLLFEGYPYNKLSLWDMWFSDGADLDLFEFSGKRIFNRATRDGLIAWAVSWSVICFVSYMPFFLRTVAPDSQQKVSVVLRYPLLSSIGLMILFAGGYWALS